MYFRKLFLLACFIFPTMFVSAKTVFIKGTTRTHITYELIPFVSVYVMDRDSAVLATGMSNDNTGLNPSSFGIDNIPWHDSYILKFTCVGYETTFVTVTLKKNQTFVDIGNVLMKRSAKLLDEVVVTATKIKMVVDKDTIIYNADAFQLSEGSMLDNLVKQLPGVELNNSGQITVNGRFISSLLLNGKDFFKGDPRIALENLPAYMVNKVKVYERERDDAYLMKNNFDMEKDLVMDVNLKKQYSIGFIANAEAGYGSDDRYLGRMFGLRFTPQSRLSFYGNTNNLNQNQKPGSSGDWNNQWTASGQTAMKRAGLDFQLYDKKGVYRLNSNLNAQFEDTDNRTLSSGIAYLIDFDRYTFGRNNYRNKNSSVTTDHELIVKKPYLWSKYSLSAGYSRWNNHGLDEGAELSEKPVETYRGELLDSLFTPGQYVSPAFSLIHSRWEKGKMTGDQYNAKLYAYVSLHNYKLVANASYDKRIAEEYSQYGLHYARATADFRNRFIDVSSERFAYDIMVASWYNPSNLEDFTVSGSYTNAGRQQTGDRALYRLDGYDGWDSFDGHSIGYLPSTRDSLFQVMDVQNSYFSKEQNMTHTPDLSLSYRLPTKYQAFISMSLPLNIEYDKLSYRRAQLDTVVNRNITLFKPRFVYASQHWGEKSNFYQEFVYSFNQSAPNLVNMLHIRDDSNPLFIRLGNPDLRNEKSHKINFRHTSNDQEKQRNIGIEMDWEALLGAIGRFTLYDETTGVRTYSPKNINGNWHIGGSFDYGQAVDKQKHWQISTSTGTRYANSVDWIALTDDGNSVRSSVRNFNLTERIRLDYRKGELHVGADLRARWSNVTSGRINFEKINSMDLNYGLISTVPLPLKFKLSTDLTLYTRNGYNYETMNTEELVWNATLSRSFLHGNMTFSVDGFDMLGQLSNVRQTMNVQGYTETWFNSVTRYVMCRMIYRLNKEPKK